MTTEAKTNWKKYGSILRKAREAKSYTLRALGELTEVDFRTILRVERGNACRDESKKRLDRWLNRQR